MHSYIFIYNIWPELSEFSCYTVRYTTNTFNKCHSLLRLDNKNSRTTYLRITIKLLNTILLSVPHFIIITNIESSVFKIVFLNISLILSPFDGVCQLDVLDWPIRWLTKPSQIKTIMKRATIYRVMDIKCGKYISKPLENINIESIYEYDIPL